MHIAVLAEFAVAKGGAEKVAIESARALADSGTAVTFLHAVSADPDPLLDHPAIRRIDLGLPDVWERSAAAAAVEGIWNANAARRVSEVLAGIAPDLVHLHQWTRAFSPSVLAALGRSPRPLVMTLHDYAAACPNGVYYRFDRSEPCDLRPLSAACLTAPCDPRSQAHKLVRVLRSVATRRALIGPREPIDVVHVSERGRSILEPLLASLPLRHRRVDNPVRASLGPPAPLGDAVVYVGRLTREKGADLVAEAAASAGLPALFVGEGPLADPLRKRPDVEVLGWRSPEAVEALLRERALLLAAPSRWYETGPLTVYEALAAGIPVVVSDRAGAAEKVGHGETGFVVPPTVDALVEAFRAASHRETAMRMGLAAHRRWITAGMTASRHAADLVSLYADILSSRAGPASLDLNRIPA